MGYFSELAHTYSVDCDRSYPSPQAQLLWRFDDLNSRYTALLEVGAPYRCDLTLSDNDIRYALTDSFQMLGEVERAMALTVEDLKQKHGIDIMAEADNTAVAQEWDEEKQVRFWDILPPQAA